MRLTTPKKLKKEARRLRMLGKMSVMMVRQDGYGAQGDAPRQAIPDYQSIYFQPENAEKRQQDVDAESNRRRSMAQEKFGFHGISTPQDEPAIRFEKQVDHTKRPELGQRKPIVRAPRLVSSKDTLKGKLTARR